MTVTVEEEVLLEGDFNDLGARLVAAMGGETEVDKEDFEEHGIGGRFGSCGVETGSFDGEDEDDEKDFGMREDGAGGLAVEGEEVEGAVGGDIGTRRVERV